MAIGELPGFVLSSERPVNAGRDSAAPHVGAQPAGSGDRLTPNGANRASRQNIPGPVNAEDADEHVNLETRLKKLRTESARLAKKIAVIGGLGTAATVFGIIATVLAANYGIEKAAIKNGVAEGLKKAGPLQVSLTPPKTPADG